MNRKNFLALGGLTAAVVVAAGIAVSARSDRTAGPTEGTGPLLPGLAGRINDVTTLTLAAGGKTVTISRPDATSSAWTVTEKSGYPAALDQVRSTIVGLSAAMAVEPRTADPARYERLGIGEAGAIHLTVRTIDGKELPTLLIGKAAQGGGVYARRAGEAQSWLTDSHIGVPATDPMQWLNRELPTIPPDKVLSVTVVRPGAPPLTRSRNDAGQKDFTVSGLPAGAKPKQSAVNEASGVLTYLSFEDVAKDDPPAKPDPAPKVTTIRSADGLILTVRLALHDDNWWATFSATVEPGKSGEVEQTAAAIRARHEGWRYRVTDFTVHTLAPTADDLIEKPEAPPAGTSGR